MLLDEYPPCTLCGAPQKSRHGLKIHYSRSHKGIPVPPEQPGVDDAPELIEIVTETIGKTKSAHKLSGTAQGILGKAGAFALVYLTVRALEPLPDGDVLTEAEKDRLTPKASTQKVLFAPLFYLLELSSPVTAGVNKIAEHNDLLQSAAAWTMYIKTVNSIRADHKAKEEGFNGFVR